MHIIHFIKIFNLFGLYKIMIIKSNYLLIITFNGSNICERFVSVIFKFLFKLLDALMKEFSSIRFAIFVFIFGINVQFFNFANSSADFNIIIFQQYFKYKYPLIFLRRITITVCVLLTFHLYHKNRRCI